MIIFLALAFTKYDLTLGEVKDEEGRTVVDGEGKAVKVPKVDLKRSGLGVLHPAGRPVSITIELRK